MVGFLKTVDKYDNKTKFNMIGDELHRGANSRNQNKHWYLLVEKCFHRHASVFLINGDSILLRFKREDYNKENRMMWTGSALSHVQSDENTRDSAIRALKEDLGIVTKPNNLIELHKVVLSEEDAFSYNYLLKLKERVPLVIDSSEVMCLEWKRINDVYNDIIDHKREYSQGFVFPFHSFVNNYGLDY